MTKKKNVKPKHISCTGPTMPGRWFSMALLTICLLTGMLPAVAQQKTIRGVVTTESGTPIDGASVNIKGTNTGTTTDENGAFTLPASSGNVLVISSIGYAQIETLIDDKTEYTIQLVAVSQDMSEVVVVGFGTQRRKDVTGAVARVDLESQKQAPNTNIGQFLQGRVPGLNVGTSNYSGGTPPISIRGQVTLGGNTNVLIILDGIQYNGSLSSINPDDIASIDVLKDASSTAVYGAQAANGVILITSRTGRLNQKPRISFRSAYTIQTPTDKNMRPHTREGYLNALKEAYYDLAYLGPDFTTPNPAFRIEDVIDGTMLDGSGQLLPNNYDWYSLGTNNGSIFENNLSISGGGDKVTYLVSGGLVDQKGYIMNDLFKRKNVRANVEVKALPWWKVGLISSGSFVNQDGAEPAIASLRRMSPLLAPYDENGNVIENPTNTVELSPFLTYYVDDYDRNNYFFANIYSDIDIPFIKGLNYRMNFGNNYRESKHYFASIYDAGRNGRAYKEHQTAYDYTFDNILTYNKNFGDHDLTATLLYGAIERRWDRTMADANGFSRLDLIYNNLGLGANQFAISDANSEALAYQMARINYKYSEKYLLTATLRRDGFSGFAKNNKYGVFPVLAAGWVVSEENFMRSSMIFDFLKIRAGYGLTGNQTTQYRSIAKVFTNAAYIFGDGGTTAFGQYVNTLGNDNLKWERTRGLNFGVDFTMLNNRLSGAFDFYNNNTFDLLYDVSLPAISGFNIMPSNLGHIRNTGFEASVNYSIIQNQDFQWSATFNFSTNRNRIVSLTGIDSDGDGKEDDLISDNLFIGRSIGTIYHYQTDGIYQLNDPTLPGFFPGSVRIVDQNRDGDITPESDRIFLGRAEPAYRMSLLNTFSYKGFNLTVFFNSVQGGKNGFLGNNNPMYFRDDNARRRNDLQSIDYWSPSNPNGKYPRVISGTHAKIEPNMYQNRSFVRLQDISLSYNLTTLLKNTGVQAINLYVSGKNLVTWTNWEGWDPETGEGLMIDGRPVLKGFTMGLNITF